MYLNSVYYVEEGFGDPVIFLHGNQEDSSIMKPLVEALKDKKQCISLDTRGCGKTKLEDEKSYDFNVLANDLHEFILAKGISQKMCFVGYSDGANILLYYALLYPETIEKMILIGPNYHYKGLFRSFRLACRIIYPFQGKRTKNQLRLMLKYPNLTEEDLQKISCDTIVIYASKDCFYKKHQKSLIESIHAKNYKIPGNHQILKSQDLKQIIQNEIEI